MNELPKKPVFTSVKSPEQLEEVFNFNVKVFSDGLGFEWTLPNLQRQISNGWEIYSLNLGNETVGVAFLKEEENILYTKQTPVKLEWRGHGLSHKIKEFFEEKARERNISTIRHICEIDDFRMISLNETHGYKKTGAKLGDETLVEWEKKI